MFLLALHRAHKRVHARRVRVLHEQLVGLLPAQGSVLDLGCGDGLLSRRLSDSLPRAQVAAMDLLVRPNAHLPVEPFDGASIPRPDNSVDALLLVDVLHHTHDPQALLREAARVTRQAVVIKDHFADAWLARPTLRLMDWVGNARHGVSPPACYWTRAQWTRAFAAAGLEVEHQVEDLQLYGPPLDWAFGRSLHFAARLRPVHR